MRLRLMTVLLSGAFAFPAAISLAQTPVPQINYKQLPEHPFEAHGLRIAIQAFNAGRFSMNVTNTTMSFIAFAPEDMALVDKTGNQLFLSSDLLLKPITLPKIGRASCRERVYVEGTAGEVKERKQTRSGA